MQVEGETLVEGPHDAAPCARAGSFECNWSGVGNEIAGGLHPVGPDVAPSGVQPRAQFTLTARQRQPQRVATGRCGHLESTNPQCPTFATPFERQVAANLGAERGLAAPQARDVRRGLLERPS